ncbi:MAG: PIN domain-containing protein [Phycisphaerales bacterium]|nr:MAG: PIN domain-containing protein [Phycisphaerales bacterium]
MRTEVSNTVVTPTEGIKTSLVFMIVLRVVFLLVLMAVGWSLAAEERIDTGPMAGHRDLILIAFTGVGLIVIALDVFVPRKSLSAIAGLFFGLIVGMVLAYGLSLIVDLIVDANWPGGADSDPSVASVVSTLKLALGVVCCYLAVSFILQTKDDVRFVIPYVEFAKERKGGRPLVLDTSVIVDGRIADIANTRIIDSELIVPRFVLQELQTIADSNDKLKRIRGRRGLDMLNKLQTSDLVDIHILDVKPERSEAGAGVDEMLVDLAKQLDGKVVTNDYNLNKVAQLRGVVVINVNDLSNALKPVVLPGETMSIKVIKPGEESGQGVGYLEDGTMVVVEGGRDKIGENIELTVTSVLQTSAGRMIFGRLEGAPAPERRRPKPPNRN